ncbi:MAG: lectin like domain-containing protein [Lachnospiraceae bacterium]
MNKRIGYDSGRLLGLMLVFMAVLTGCGQKEEWRDEVLSGIRSVLPESEMSFAPDADAEEMAAQDTGLEGIEFSWPESIELPSSYDYRLEGRAADVKNQGSLGTCWAFSSLMALETSLLPEEDWDFSEDHMSIRNSFGMTQEEGGDYSMAMAYLLAWQGPVREEDDPYGDLVSPEELMPVKHVQEVRVFPFKDYTRIKEAVYLYGGVESSIYTDLEDTRSQSVFYDSENYAHFYNGTEEPNHRVVIVGWDDDYPRENFKVQPKGDGAFICANSWGSEFGDEGFFYVSYFDVNIGSYNVLYSGVEPPDNYDYIYQTDLCGWNGQLGYREETAYFSNVYQADSEQILKAVGFYAVGAETEFTVYVENEMGSEPSLENAIPVAEGSFWQEGFYTVPLEREIALAAGERFCVIVKIKTPGASQPIATECSSPDGGRIVDLSDGEGYCSFDGINWEHVEEKHECNLCLKAYTIEKTIQESEESQ